MTSIIKKIRSRSRSKSVEPRRNAVEKRRPSSDPTVIMDVNKTDTSENENSSHHYSRSSADSGVSSTNEVTLSVSSLDENALSDEQDCIGNEISGTLAFADNVSSPTSTRSLSFERDLTYSLPWDGNHSTVINILFEVISADVIKDGRSSHVIYTVLINPDKDGSERHETLIRRRYSDFENLHQALRKRFSSVMSNVSFPRKMLMGNFTSETIAKRSTAFEQYLSHLFSYFEVRYSQEYMEFFVEDSFYCAIDHFLKKEYTAAVPFLEETIPVLEKLYGYFHPKVIQCVCCLVVCFKKMNLPNAALSCSDIMLQCCIPESSSANDELRCAALVTGIHLSWTAGRDKAVFEKKLEEMRKGGFDVEGAKELEQILLTTLQINASTWKK